MEIILAILVLVAALALIGGIAMLFFKAKRKRGFKIAGISFIAMLGLVTAFGLQVDGAAKQAGFLDADDQAMAQRAGVTSSEEWAGQRDEYLAQYAAKLAAEQAAQEQREQEERAAQAQAEATQRAVEKAERDRLAEESAAREVAAVEAQQAADAAATAKENARKARLAKKTQHMTDGIVARARSHLSVEPEPLIPSQPLCRQNGYCDFSIGLFRVQVYGAGLATVETTNQASRTDYLEMCAVVFSGISGADMQYAVETVGIAYGAALTAGRFERDFSGVEVKVSPSLGDDLQCRFFKY